MREDVQAVCQATLDLPALQQYLHEGAPGRKPLRLVNGADLPADLALSKFGEPVVWVGRDEAAQARLPYLELRAVDVSGETADVRFTYPIEGISGAVRLTKSNGTWRVESSNLSEK